MEVPTGDVMRHLLESQRMILISIMLDRHCFDHLWKFLTVSSLGDPLKRACSTHTKISEGDFSQKIEVQSKMKLAAHLLL